MRGISDKMSAKRRKIEPAGFGEVSGRGAVSGDHDGAAEGDEEGSHDSEAEEVTEDLPVNVVEQLIQMTGSEFLAEYWGKRPCIRQVSEKLLEKMVAAFGDGELENVMPFCRQDNNAFFTPETMQDMSSAFAEKKQTINLPLCYNAASNKLRNSFIKTFPGVGNDIEVGVYFSQTTGEHTPYHLDHNHNITIQLTGEKDWSIIPGDPNVAASRGMEDPARNMFEGKRAIPGVGSAITYTLRPGTVIYLPPGYWHKVVSVGKDDSCSVDLRVASVLQARWLAEATHAGILDVFHATGAAASSLTEMAPDTVGTSDRSLTARCDFVAENLRKLLHECPFPRGLPFEEHESNGMLKAASLAFLANELAILEGSKQGRLLSALKEGSSSELEIGMNRLVWITTKQLSGAELAIHLVSHSTLTGMEYLNHRVFCDAYLLPAVTLLAQQPRVKLSELLLSCPENINSASAIRYRWGGTGREWHLPTCACHLCGALGDIKLPTNIRKLAKILNIAPNKLPRLKLVTLLCTLLSANVIFLSHDFPRSPAGSAGATEVT